MEKESPYRIERLETLAQLDTLELEWKELIDGIPDAPVFLTWEWIRTWWSFFGKDNQLWLLTARDSQERLLGLAPLMVEQKKIGLTNLRVISFIGIGLTHPVHLDILTHQSDQEGLVQAFLDYLLSRSNLWDVIKFTPVAKDSVLYKLLSTAKGVFRLGIKTTNVYVTLPGDWETYSKTLTKKLRRNLKYFRSKLDSDYPGGVSFSYITDPRELHDVMKKLEELNKERWHSKQRISNFAYSNYSDFHQAFAKMALERGWLRLNQLTTSGHSIAICYNFRFHDRIYANAIGFDLDWSGYSPGRLAIANSFQTSIQERAIEYNWLGGDEAYKFAWSDQVRVENELLFSKNWRGALWIKWRSFTQVSRDILTTKARQWIPQTTRERFNQFLYRMHRKMERQDDKDSG
ncbi:MAG TPA: GNAT family N-acetyltransferase [Anaerolineales bacterium]|jgi:hypothetical protein